MIKRRSISSLLLLSCLAAVTLSLIAGCGGRLRRELAGGATVENRDVLDAQAAPPKMIYVADFTANPADFKQPSGIVSEVLDNRPHLLGGGGEGGAGGGVLGRIGSSDAADPAQVVDQLSSSIADGLNSQQLGFQAVRIAPGAPPPASGWLVRGRIVGVDPGNRAERAVIGFGTGQATAEVQVEVDRLEPDGQVPVMRFGTKSDSGKAPGAVVTMNPYVAAAKFVIGKNATSRDINALGQEIAKQIADYARSRGVGNP
jgi:hypothetical protein